MATEIKKSVTTNGRPADSSADIALFNAELVRRLAQDSVTAIDQLREGDPDVNVVLSATLDTPVTPAGVMGVLFTVYVRGCRSSKGFYIKPGETLGKIVDNLRFAVNTARDEESRRNSETKAEANAGRLRVLGDLRHMLNGIDSQADPEAHRELELAYRRLLTDLQAGMR